MVDDHTLSSAQASSGPSGTPASSLVLAVVRDWSKRGGGELPTELEGVIGLRLRFSTPNEDAAAGGEPKSPSDGMGDDF